MGMKTLGEQLIHRSSGLLKDFRMDLATNIILREKPKLKPSDIKAILSRYKQHVAFWDIGLETIQQELQAFSDASQVPYEKTAIAFNGIKVSGEQKQTRIQPDVTPIIDKLKHESKKHTTRYVRAWCKRNKHGFSPDSQSEYYRRGVRQGLRIARRIIEKEASK